MAQGPQLALVPDRCLKEQLEQLERDYRGLQKINYQLGVLVDLYREEAEQLRHRNYDQITSLPQAA